MSVLIVPDVAKDFEITALKKQLFTEDQPQIQLQNGDPYDGVGLC
jgi:hypothetical protein